MRAVAADRMPAAAPLAERFAAVRAEFPILAREVGGRPLVYLDSAATSQKPRAVLDAERRYYERSNANVHRGLHTLGDEATQAYEACRERVADFVNAGRDAATVITRGATSALNAVAQGFEHELRPGDEILLSEMEHHANLVPWIQLARRRGVVLRHVPFTPGGELDRAAFGELLGPRTRIVSLVHVSNVLGTINPIAELAAEARAAGALVVVDAAQSVGHLPVDFQALGADLLAFSAHKVYGPMGLGFLVGRRAVLARMEPYEGGGEMIQHVFLDRATWADVPHRFEAGTPNVAAAAAFPPALDLLDGLGLDAVRAHEEELTAYALERLRELDGLVVYGPPDAARRGGLVTFHDPQVHPHDLATVLDSLGVAVRAGHHCAQPLHRRLGVVATTRASFGVYSRAEDVDALVAGVGEARAYFGR
jgi:cysteine desulfurase/selenocysteine lyase